MKLVFNCRLSFRAAKLKSPQTQTQRSIRKAIESGLLIVYLANVACKGYESKFKSTLSESVTKSIPSLRSSTVSCTSTTSSKSCSLNPKSSYWDQKDMIRNLTSTKLPSDSVKIPALFHRSPTSFVSFSNGSALRC